MSKKYKTIEKIIDNSELVYTAGKCIDSASFEKMVEELKNDINELIEEKK